MINVYVKESYVDYKVHETLSAVGRWLAFSVHVSNISKHIHLHTHTKHKYLNYKILAKTVL